jgi:TRAP-type mannitol/chloroaromatic compound transport system permease small subunit
MWNAMRFYVRHVDRLSTWTGILAMNLIFVLVGVLLLDAVTRNVLDIPLHWCIEFAQFVLTAYYFVGGPFTMLQDQHVRMDLLYERLGPMGKARLDVITDFCLIFYLAILLFGSISSTVYAIETDQRNFSMWNPSMIPIKCIMVVSIVLMILQSISIFFKDIAKVRGEELQ